MVYCVKCGTKNPDDAEVCSQCGASLHITGESEQHRRVESGCYGPRRSREPYRRVEDECFGIPRGGTIAGIVIGLIIILVGLNLFLQTMYPDMPQIPWWSFIIIIFGLLMIIGAIYGMRRRY
jgi:uncharacterized membrane protein YvbJ